VTEQLYDRTAEQSVLAVCMISRPARDEARRHLSGGDFYDPKHEVLWDAMARLDRFDKAVDPTTVLAAVNHNREVIELLPNLVTTVGIPEHVSDYADVVRSWAMRRRLVDEAIRVQAHAMNPAANVAGFAAQVATRFATLRDSGITDDAQSITLDELLAEPDDEPDWLIPGLLERRDRMILTGEEGLGKSYLLRQIAVMAAAGLDPFDPGKRFKPLSVTIFDCENSERQVKRKVRPVVEFARRVGTGHPGQVNLLCSPRVDITRDKDLARLHFELDATRPDILVIGPLYRLTQGALQNDDDAAPVLAALDTLRDRDISLLIEAHAGHGVGQGGQRNLRPRGSSALLGWPEFGYGMRDIGGGFVDVVPWRGDRDERWWPSRVRRAPDHIRWIPVEAEQAEWSPAGAIA
jgi:hypothetical protein